MSVAAVNSSSLVQEAPNVPVALRLPTQTLNQEDFLQLVVAQMSNQDPMNPQKDTEFIAQMAQFSALEQSKAMQSDIAQLRSEQQLLQANALIGRAVELQDSQGALITGTVSGVQVTAGTPQIVVNGQAHDLRALRSIAPAADPS
jgi:flagellar basal-body rod modification protein FlgD